MTECTDPTIGELLHAYELDFLEGEEVERFKLHLLDCEYCSEELKAFDPQVELLFKDPDVRALIEEGVTVDEAHDVDLGLPAAEATPASEKPEPDDSGQADPGMKDPNSLRGFCV